VQTIREYLALPNVLCVGGSWLTPEDKVLAHDWAGIESIARFNCELVKVA
jgi:2-dehydro-3-deoxyphosphogluconate aldolase/(4S)-4-hydroxy-2-oxoglutarate aldolase